MDFYNVVFYLFAFIILISAAGVVFSKNIMHSAFSLLFTFFGVAGFYVLLNADFIAITQIMVYIGGILILIIFGIMLTQKVVSIDIKGGTTGRFSYIVASALSALLAVLLILLFTNSNWVRKEAALPDETVSQIGILLLTDYLLAFEVAAVLLLIAFIGAALIARRGNK